MIFHTTTPNHTSKCVGVEITFKHTTTPPPFMGGGCGGVVVAVGRGENWSSTPVSSTPNDREFMMQNKINFSAPPPVGTVVEFGPGKWVTLVGVEPYVRVDGTPTHILRWVSSGGQACSSGLVAKSVTFPPKWKRHGVPA